MSEGENSYQSLGAEEGIEVPEERKGVYDGTGRYVSGEHRSPEGEQIIADFRARLSGKSVEERLQMILDEVDALSPHCNLAVAYQENGMQDASIHQIIWDLGLPTDERDALTRYHMKIQGMDVPDVDEEERMKICPNCHRSARQLNPCPHCHRYG